MTQEGPRRRVEVPPTQEGLAARFLDEGVSTIEAMLAAKYQPSFEARVVYARLMTEGRVLLRNAMWQLLFKLLQYQERQIEALTETILRPSGEALRPSKRKH